jgi:hypothetical protein
MVFNITFNNISVISWRSILLVENGIPGVNHRPAASHCQTPAIITQSKEDQYQTTKNSINYCK